MKTHLLSLIFTILAINRASDEKNITKMRDHMSVDAEYEHAEYGGY
jgi:hypothetical protein